MITARIKRGRSHWRSLKALERLIPIRVAQIIWHTLKSFNFTTSPIALLIGAGLNPNIQFSNDNNLYGSREVMRFCAMFTQPFTFSKNSFYSIENRWRPASSYFSTSYFKHSIPSFETNYLIFLKTISKLIFNSNFHILRIIFIL